MFITKFNFNLETTSGKYFVKIFSNFRKDEDCKQYVNKITKAVESGVSFPKLFKSDNEYLHITKVKDAKLRLCVMEHIDGENYFSLGETPNSNEIKSLARQAALINTINLKHIL